MKKLLITAILLAICAVSVRAETLYVSRDGTILRTEPNATSTVVATMDAGQPLEVISRGARFVQVKTSHGQKGWIYVYSTTSEAPSQEAKDEFAILARGRDVRASEAETGSAIRGLEPVAEQNAVQNKINPEIIEQFKSLDAYVVKEEDLKAFMKEGRLGEFGG